MDAGLTLITVGLLLLLGLVTDLLCRRTALPRVTLLLLFGFAMGGGGKIGRRQSGCSLAGSFAL